MKHGLLLKCCANQRKIITGLTLITLIFMAMTQIACETDRRTSSDYPSGPHGDHHVYELEPSAYAHQVAGYFWVTDEYGVPMDGVRVTWDYAYYTGPGVSSGFRALYYTGGYYELDDGRPVNLYPPVMIDTYEGSDIVFSFSAEGYYQAMFAYQVPYNTYGASSFHQVIAMRRL